MGGGILPVAKHNGKIYFLFGLEEYDKTWTDFGGSSELNETPYKTAIREGYEELNGFLGSKSNLQKMVSKNIILKLKFDNYTTFLFKTPYDESLPQYFNAHHKFLNTNLPQIINKKGYYEKCCIQWMTLREIKENKYKFRTFYQAIIDFILHNEDVISGTF
jgi:hypothetical protein